MKTTINTGPQIPTTKKENSGKDIKEEFWFTINALGFFKYISPSLLEYLEEMDNQFFESVLFEKSDINELPSPAEYLTDMINPERVSVFVEEVLNINYSETGQLYWNIFAEDSLLRFTLSETPPTVEAGTGKLG